MTTRRITLAGYGTRGDVQPFVALAWALRQRGHATRLLVPRNLLGWAARAGVPCSELPVDTQRLLRAEAGQRMLARGDIHAFFAWLAREERAYAGPMRAALRAGCQDADLIITHALLEDRLAAIGAARRVPVLPVYFFPQLASSALASPFISTRSWGPLNRLTHSLLATLLWRMSRDEVHTLREELGMPPAERSFLREVQRRDLPVLLAYSRHLHEPPADWGAQALVGGAITMPGALRTALGEHGLPPDLQRWLAEGPPPLYVGLGSMPLLDPMRTWALVGEVCLRLGVRAVVAAGWSQLPSGPQGALFGLGEVDHSALLPRCRAAMHHGGSGTVHATLGAGLPTLVTSVFADQPFWGARVRTLGVGAHLPFARLDAASVEEGLREVLQPDVVRRAGGLGERLRRDEGLERAVAWVEQLLAAPPRVPA